MFYALTQIWNMNTRAKVKFLSESINPRLTVGGGEMSELAKAGITDPLLIDSYNACKKLNSSHGKTYYLATLLLPAEKRPHVHALYGFARYADEIVDTYNSTIHEKTTALEAFSSQTLRELESGVSNHPIGAALINTVNEFSIDHQLFISFLNSMKMDLTVSTYENFDALMKYVYGSANVIGLQMLPILGTANGGEVTQEIKEAAEALGAAFQLANFLRDVGEDLDRGRIYLPLDELAAHNVSIEMLNSRKLTPQIKDLLKFEIERVRQLRKRSEPGLALLHPTSRPCIEAASELYCGIVDEIEKIDYEIFNKRATTSTFRRLSVALPAYLRAVAAR
jgi:phytoene synthase